MLDKAGNTGPKGMGSEINMLLNINKMLKELKGQAHQDRTTTKNEHYKVLANASNPAEAYRWYQNLESLRLGATNKFKKYEGYKVLPKGGNTIEQEEEVGMIGAEEEEEKKKHIYQLQICLNLYLPLDHCLTSPRVWHQPQVYLNLPWTTA